MALPASAGIFSGRTGGQNARMANVKPETTDNLTALCQAAPLACDGTDVPEWVHLLPAGQITTQDGRGPYNVASMDGLIAASLGGWPGGVMGTRATKLPIDECHATDKAAPMGLPAPARGWIIALAARVDGLWGRVEWTGEGRRLMADGAYAGISPVILHSKSGEVRQLLRASLTNTPNLRGLVALQEADLSSLDVDLEDAMDWKVKLIELLGLEAGADDAAIDVALQARLGGAVAAHAVLEHPSVLALQGQVTTLTDELAGLRADGARRAAETFVDGAIAAGRVGVTPLRDDYIALHMENPTRAEALVGAMPVVAAGALSHAAAHGAQSGGASGMDDAGRMICALMQVDEAAYLAAQKNEHAVKGVL